MNKTITLLLLIFAFSGCKTQKAPFALNFGSGGGFTGLYTSYSLAPNGRLTKDSSSGNLSLTIATLKGKELSEIIALVSKADLQKITINNPGNMTDFITLMQDKKEYRTQWASGPSGNAALDELYKKLQSYISKK